MRFCDTCRSTYPTDFTTCPKDQSVLRETETRALVHLGLDALSEAHTVGHELHKLLYGKDEIPDDRRQELLAETLTCMETAEHYLLMLGSVFEEHPARNGPPAAVPE